MTDPNGANEVLILTPFFSPNIGGVETHLDDLVNLLKDQPFHTYVLTYQPLMLQTKAPTIEQKGNVEIHRVEWIRKLFYKLEPYPLLDFLYLTPRLLIATLFFLINHPRVKVIHAQGINAACIAIILKSLFKTKVVISTHAVYEFQGESLFAKITRFIFNRADTILSLLNHSKKELVKLGVNESKISPYTYWVDQQLFTIKDKTEMKKDLNWDTQLSHVLFVGRLIEKKGVRELIQAAQTFRANTLIHIIGTGDLDNEVNSAAKNCKNIVFHGKVDNSELPRYMQAADALIVPSTHEEGAGRVIMEALSCGTPVIGANRGGIPEILTSEVSELITVAPENIVRAINNMQTRIKNNEITTDKCRSYAQQHFSNKNAEKIIATYNI